MSAFEVALQAYYQNASCWSKLTAHSFHLLSLFFEQCEENGMDPSNTKFPAGKDQEYWQQQFQSKEQLQFALRCLASNGYDSWIWTDGVPNVLVACVCQRKMMIASENKFDCVLATPDPREEAKKG